MRFNLDIDGKKKEIDINNNEETYEFTIGDNTSTYRVKKIWGRNFIIIDSENRVYDVFVDKSGEGHCVFFKGRSFKIKDGSVRKKRGGFDIEGEVLIKSPLPGQIKKILKNDGDEVENGEGIVVLEAMKMENEIKSPKKGKIKKIFVEENSSVEPQGKLFIVE
ncbi:MAG: biotin/lipoyl-containing protein [Acidobacteriota bacterium]